ncbi:MAG: hypothetical protein A2Z34_06670 [Planctomycetes bacterium RBG_16_59_8]|nr:MAG: hypothetical protein A2Z34_06670 [Planctomycetes bacterium RBG_16_59_8]
MKYAVGIVVVVILVGGGALLFREETSNNGQTAPVKTMAKPKYHCPMHPTYTSDRPGECPICGMNLEPIGQDENASSPAGISGYATVKINAEKQQLIGVKKGKVASRPFTTTVRAAGRIGYNERKVYNVNTKFGGWIEKADSLALVGKFVEAGTPLFNIYSPDLITAQREYLAAMESGKKAEESKFPEMAENAWQLAKAIRQRLLFWDISEEQIDRMVLDGKPSKTLWMTAPAEGFIIGDELTNGKYVAPGELVFTIVDLSTVWIEAEIYEYELTNIDVGGVAEMGLSAYPGEKFEGVVTYIYPYLNPVTRTVKVRIEMPNPDYKLKIDMYTDSVTLKKELGEKVAIPVEAVMDTGTRQIAFVDKGDGLFEPRELKVGVRSGDGYYEVLDGVSDGETVVTSGNFLIDSESKLKSALSTEGSGHKHGGE